MDELYGVQSTCSDHYSVQQPLPENIVAGSPVDYYSFPSPGISFSMLASDSEQLFSGPSVVSDTASMVVEMQGSCGDDGGASEEEVSSAIRAKIASHPLYPRLLQAYIDCQKVGATPEMAGMLDEIRQETDLSSRHTAVISCLGADPELDEFMENYCDILVKYKSDLSRHFNEATIFLNDIEAQLHALCNTTITASITHTSDEAVCLSDEDVSTGEEVELQESGSANDDRERKDKLLQKYSGYIRTLKQEFSKTKKKGKLPKEARQILLHWWNIHSNWPYPTEADKGALADATGLDQKQINNWFINQRKRHWKLSDQNMQFADMEILYGTLFHD